MLFLHTLSLFLLFQIVYLNTIKIYLIVIYIVSGIIKRGELFSLNLFVELFLLGVGLAMDAFAVSICKGLSMTKVNKLQAVIIGLFFGGFQALMPLVGWLLGVGFQQYIEAVDHWVAFALLAFIGGKMIFEALSPEDIEQENKMDRPLNIKEMIVLAFATSIDALAVGVTFAFLDYPIFESISIIGVVTFIISVLGVFIGNFFGSKYKNKAEFAGGVILILIGLKILLEGLELIHF